MSPIILPQPQQIVSSGSVWRKRHQSHFSSDVALGIHGPSCWEGPMSWLANSLEEHHLFRVSRTSADQADVIFRDTLSPSPLPCSHEGIAHAGFADEHHRIVIEPGRILVEAASSAGAARAVASLRQLLSGQRARLEIPCQIIEDAPTLVWRGLHLDASRHFWTVDDVCRFLDLAALHKFNVFHWHLTDDQGWRLPVEGFPRLTECAAWREGTMIGHDCNRATNGIDGVRHGGFYTQDDIRRVVAHAADRGMHVLPEIDVPGHVQALLTAYPEFGNSGTAPGVRTCWGISPHTLNLEPQTLEFLDRVVETLAGLFPFPLVHLGGDEARTGEWSESPRVGLRMQELGIHDVRDIQTHFTNHLVECLTRHGRRMVGWDEIIEHKEPDSSAVVMYWRDSEKTDLGLDHKALKNRNGLVLANWSKTYLDLYQMAGPGSDFEPLAICGKLTLEDIYRWNPLARFPVESQPLVWGAQGQVWTEYISRRNHLDYMVYPRACALAQVLWRGERREDFPAFSRRLQSHLPFLDRLGVTYRPSFPAP